MSRKETPEQKKERLFREEQKNPAGNFNDSIYNSL